MLHEENMFRRPCPESLVSGWSLSHAVSRDNAAELKHTVKCIEKWDLKNFLAPKIVAKRPNFIPNAEQSNYQIKVIREVEYIDSIRD